MDLRTFRGTGASAFLADNIRLKRGRGIRTERCLGKVDLYPSQNVTTFCTLSAPWLTEESGIPEYRPEKIVEATEPEQVIHVDCVAAVIASPSLGIGEDFIGFSHLLEPVLGGGITRIGIGVCLPSETTECLLDLF